MYCQNKNDKNLYARNKAVRLDTSKSTQIHVLRIDLFEQMECLSTGIE